MFKSMLVLMLAFSLLLMTACTDNNDNGGSSASKNDSNSDTDVANVDPLGKYEPGIEITLAGVETDPGEQGPAGMTYEDNSWLTAYEDELGITFEDYWIVKPDRSEEKINLQIASGDIPDLMMVSTKQYEMLVNYDLVENLTDVYEAYATDLTKELMVSDDGKSMEMAKVGGKLYAIPWVNGYADTANVMWLRSDWLKELNLDPPSTLDELQEVMKAFVEKDPAGKDTIGVATTNSLWELQSIFNGFNAYPNSWILQDNGEIVYGGIQTEVKDALKYMQTLYEDGLLHKEFGVMTFDKVIEQLSSGQVGVHFGQWWNPAWPLNFSRQNDPEADWLPYPIPTGNGVAAKPLASYGTQSGYFVVKKGYEHPEAIIKLLNLWFEKMYGPDAEPEKYSKTVDGGEIFWYAKVASWKAHEDLEAYLKIQEALKSNDTSELNPQEKQYYDGVTAFMDGNQEQWINYKMYGPESASAIIDQYLENDLLQFSEYYGTGTPAMLENGSTLEKLQVETFVRIIMGGELSEFDQFVEKWKSLGGDQMTKEVNEWYQNK